MKRVALVGCGHIHTPSFVDKLNSRSGCLEVAGVWDHDAGRAAMNAEKLGSVAVSSPEKIWQDGTIDGVVICSETRLHRELVYGAVEAGKHLFVEKPLGFSAADALAMAGRINESGVIFQTGYFMRGNPVYIFLQGLIAQGAFGRISRIRHSNCHCGALKGWFDGEWRWMADPEQSGCGGFGDLGTHSLDIIMWLLGAVPEKVTAATGNLTYRYGKECDEYGEGMLLFGDGTVGTLAAGWVDVSNPVSCEICGTLGHAVVMEDKLYLQSERVKGAEKLTLWETLPAIEPHAFDIFLDVLLGGKGKLVTADECAMRNVVMESMYEGARTNSWIKIGN